ncbi:MAG TPA: hypothetical protein VJ917_00330, partial [Saprospiraceae bacterium]|nr:hypothetical protein [Saprospiraceae bacterium]
HFPSQWFGNCSSCPQRWLSPAPPITRRKEIDCRKLLNEKVKDFKSIGNLLRLNIAYRLGGFQKTATIFKNEYYE